jgi:hypothetical protein
VGVKHREPLTPRDTRRQEKFGNSKTCLSPAGRLEYRSTRSFQVKGQRLNEQASPHL